MKTIFLTPALLVTSIGLAMSFPISQHYKINNSNGLMIKIQASDCKAKKGELADRNRELGEMDRFMVERKKAGKDASGVMDQIKNAMDERWKLEDQIKRFC